VHDIPREFNCHLIDNPLNHKNVRASKAVGEPPLLLSISVWAAIKNALQYRAKKPIPLRVPATQEHIFMTMKDHHA
jgi:xanthine dehydrogenase large subunit